MIWAGAELGAEGRSPCVAELEDSLMTQIS